MKSAHSVGSLLAIGAGIVAVHLVIYVALRGSGVIIRVVKEGGITLLSRISGLLLSAIAVQLIATSVKAFAKGG